MSLSLQPLSFYESWALFLRLASMIVAPDPSHKYLSSPSHPIYYFQINHLSIPFQFGKVKEIDWSKVVEALENLVKNYLPILEGPITLKVSEHKNDICTARL